MLTSRMRAPVGEPFITLGWTNGSVTVTLPAENKKEMDSIDLVREIGNAELLTETFGRWPSLHDAQVIWMLLDITEHFRLYSEAFTSSSVGSGCVEFAKLSAYPVRA